MPKKTNSATTRQGYRVVDARHDDADRALASWTQTGADVWAVKALLPALVGPEPAAKAARDWLSINARIGHGVIDPYEFGDGRAAERESARLGRRAAAYLNQLKESGAFAGGGPMYDPSDRFAQSGEDVAKAYDRSMANAGHPVTEGRYSLAGSAEEFGSRTADGDLSNVYEVDSDDPATWNILGGR